MSNPPVTSALVRSVGEMLDIPVDVSELDRAAIRFNSQVARAISDDSDVAAYVRQLEDRDHSSQSDESTSDSHESAETELPNADILVQELDDFFRKRGQPPRE